MRDFIVGGGAAALVAAVVAALRVRSQNRIEQVRAEGYDLSESRSAAVLIQLAQGAAVVQSDVIKQVREQLAAQGAELARCRELIPQVSMLEERMRGMAEDLRVAREERDKLLAERAGLYVRIQELESKVASLEVKTG